VPTANNTALAPSSLTNWLTPMVGVVHGLNAQASNSNYQKSPSLAHVCWGFFMHLR
jgi:hypothetical protein